MKKKRVYIKKKPLMPSREYYDLPPANRYYLKHDIPNLQVAYYHSYDGSIVLELRLR